MANKFIIKEIENDDIYLMIKPWLSKHTCFWFSKMSHVFIICVGNDLMSKRLLPELSRDVYSPTLYGVTTELDKKISLETGLTILKRCFEEDDFLAIQKIIFEII